MQTILCLQSSQGGIISINGRMAGEIDREHPLYLPISPTGVLFLQMHPFEHNLLPLALRLTLSQGIPILGQTADNRFCAALWYGSILEIELIPQHLPSDGEIFLFEQGGIRFSLRDNPAVLICETQAGSFTHPLPDGAQPPALMPLDDALMLRGICGGRLCLYGCYLTLFSPYFTFSRS